MPHSGVQLKFDRSGGVSIFCGATEIGQGSDDVLAGIVAEVLGIDTFDIRLFTGDTDLGPVDLGSDRKSTRLNSSHLGISYAVFCLKKKNDPAAADLCPTRFISTALAPTPTC